VKSLFPVCQIGVILSLLFACGQGNEPVEFLKHWVIDPHPNSGKECCTDILMLGDINGDGKLDIIIGAQGAEGAGLVWYQFPTWEKHPVASGEFTTDGQTADIDGDGDLDIVVGTFAQGKGEILWFENSSGDGSEWARHTVGNGYAHDLVVGDVNGDGKLDIVTCDKKKITLWLQVAPGVFQGQIILERPGEGTALADIDGDGDLDIVFGGSWLENPGSLAKGQWISHSIAKQWPADTRVAVADMNNDGRPDVVLSVSEGEGPLKGRLSWFEAPKNPRADAWVEHPIDKEPLEGVHSLQVADIDGDGDLDVIAAEMHTSRNKRVLVYIDEGGTFKPVVLSRRGSHNMRVGDIDGDGDFDIVGKNYAGPGRVIEMWENLTSGAKKWAYISIDGKRPKTQKGKMGLVFADADRDGLLDVIAGSYWYRNPGGNLHGEWKRTLIAEEGMDVFFAIDVDGDEYSDLIGIKDSTVYWIEATDRLATAWRARPVGEIAKGGRTQGYVKAQIIPGKKPQLVFTRGKNLYVLEVPTDPDRALWPLHRISTQIEEEGIAVGDIDGDGDLDIAAVSADCLHVIWLENPGSLPLEWKMYFISGQLHDSQMCFDRIAIADLNGNNRLDVIATEERQDWELAAHLYWFESPADPKKGTWNSHVIARHRSLNSLDIADVDGDGNVDIVVAEHTDQQTEGAPDNLTVIYLNRYRARSWVPHVVERGPHSSHLGAKFVDLDNDKVSELVSIAWNQWQSVHLWKKVANDYEQRESSPNR